MPLILEFAEPLDNEARLYRAVRDITRGSDVANGMKIAVLELIMAELVRDLQASIDAL
jgi:hypothetical protein